MVWPAAPYAYDYIVPSVMVQSPAPIQYLSWYDALLVLNILITPINFTLSLIWPSLALTQLAFYATNIILHGVLYFRLQNFLPQLYKVYINDS